MHSMFPRSHPSEHAVSTEGLLCGHLGGGEGGREGGRLIVCIAPKLQTPISGARSAAVLGSSLDVVPLVYLDQVQLSPL